MSLVDNLNDFTPKHDRTSDIEKKYSFLNNDRGVYTPCYVPTQTAFVMKPSATMANSGLAYEERKKLAQPVLFSNVGKDLNYRSGLFITKDSSRRFDEIERECIGGFLSKEQDELFLPLNYYMQGVSLLSNLLMQKANFRP